MLKIVLIAVAALIAVFALIVAVQPAKFRMARTATIDAPPHQVFAAINDFHVWQKWSPWAKLDPNMKTTYSGPEAGPGAVYTWAGNAKAGEGKMTLLDSEPNKTVKVKLEFLKPFAATNEALFELEPRGDKTIVTWSMTGHNNFMAKAFNLVMNMDKIVGADFEKGLASLNEVARH